MTSTTTNVQLLDLPLDRDILTEILTLLEVDDLLRLRLLSKAFYELVQQKSLWVSLCQRHTSSRPDILWPCQDLANFTSKQLEYLLRRWQGVSTAWSTPGGSPWSQSELHIPGAVQDVKLVPGGRWLLIGMKSGDIHSYNLDCPTNPPALVIPASVPSEGAFQARVKISIDIRKDTTVFEFNIAVLLLLIPFGRDSIDPPVNSCCVRVFRICSEQDNEGVLRAEQLSEHFVGSQTLYCYALALKNNKVVYSLQHQPTDGHSGTFQSDLFVVDWTRVSEGEAKVVLPGRYAGWMEILTGDRILFRTPATYEIIDLNAPYPEGESAWSTNLRSAFISRPFVTSDSTRFVVPTLDGVMGLIIPHPRAGDTFKSPSVVKLLGGKYMGFSGAYGYHHGVSAQNWNETTLLRYSWPDDPEDPPSAASMVKKNYAFERSPYGYPTVFMDESSGRVISLQCPSQGFETTVRIARFASYA